MYSFFLFVFLRGKEREGQDMWNCGMLFSETYQLNELKYEIAFISLDSY